MGGRRRRVSPFARAAARTSALVLVGVDGTRALVAYASGPDSGLFHPSVQISTACCQPRETPVYARARLGRA
jgi:hypothetical protein